VKRRWLLSIFALALALGAARTAAAGDPREVKAREDFAVGRYQEALEAFGKLYAETLHPTYLRNIGRCYQNLGQPDKAISSFREYLRKRTGITPEERAEVEGFIAEMQEMKKQQAAEASASSAAPSTPPKSTMVVRAPEPKNEGGTPVLIKEPATPPSEESSPVYTRWWFWTLLGAAAAGVGIGVFAATGGFTKTQDAGCPTGATCPR